MLNRMINAVFIATLFAVMPAYAAFDDELQMLQQHWSSVRYQTSGDERKKQLEKLVAEADSFAKKYPDKADSHLWAGVIRGSLAEAINGMGALSFVKEAKVNLEKSIEIDAKAEGSYALGVLGLMYAKVPSWPIAYGDNKKGKALLQQGVEASPDGMNINYLYASYLFEKDDYAKAKIYIQKAQQAAPPAPAEIWSGRQKEIHELAEKINAKAK